MIEALQADGYYPVMAAELEFYLLDAQRDSRGRPQPARDADGGRPRATQVYGLRELEQIEPFLADLYTACKLQGIAARTAISEYAPGQVEITLEHRSDALQAMDEAVRYKRLVKGVAHKHGMQACFMAKPFDHLAGSGMHMHVSLADREGHNLFASEAADGTPLLRQAVGDARHLARFDVDVLSERQLLPAIPKQQLRTAGGDLGRGQPHRELEGAGRPGVLAAHRASYLRRRCQPLPGSGGDIGRHSSRPA